MKKPILILLPIAFSLFLCFCENQSTRKGIYELQEKCGKTASEFFERESLGSEGRDSSYTSHYSIKLSKCFILINFHFYSKDTGGFLRLMLHDVNENNEIGSFSKFYGFQPYKDELQDCTVRDKTCKSEAEWDALIKPYMEE